MKFTGVEFVEQDIVLDGHQWIGCEFTRCVIHFTAETDVLQLHGCFFNDVRWSFDHAAGRTIQMLHALYMMGARPMVDALVDSIRTPEPAP